MNEIPSDTTGKPYQGVDHLKQLAAGNNRFASRQTLRH